MIFYIHIDYNWVRENPQLTRHIIIQFRFCINVLFVELNDEMIERSEFSFRSNSVGYTNFSGRDELNIKLQLTKFFKMSAWRNSRILVNTSCTPNYELHFRVYQIANKLNGPCFHVSFILVYYKLAFPSK